MLRDYEIVSPSLEGVLNHEVLAYEGLSRPTEIFRIMDGPATRGKKKDGLEGENSEGKDGKVDFQTLEKYFYDLYGVFMKKLSYFVVDSNIPKEDQVTLQAMLQEMIKVKNLISRFAK
jgi:hypothetical protein